MFQKNVNKDKYEKYLESLDERGKRYVKIICDNLIYIRTEELVEMVTRSVRKITAQNEKYNLYIPGEKIGSEHYLTMRMKDELNPVSVITD